jgi:hypothetical protein
MAADDRRSAGESRHITWPSAAAGARGHPVRMCLFSKSFQRRGPAADPHEKRPTRVVRRWGVRESSRRCPWPTRIPPRLRGPWCPARTRCAGPWPDRHRRRAHSSPGRPEVAADGIQSCSCIASSLSKLRRPGPVALPVVPVCCVPVPRVSQLGPGRPSPIPGPRTPARGHPPDPAKKNRATVALTGRLAPVLPANGTRLPVSQGSLLILPCQPPGKRRPAFGLDSPTEVRPGAGTAHAGSPPPRPHWGPELDPNPWRPGGTARILPDSRHCRSSPALRATAGCAGPGTPDGADPYRCVNPIRPSHPKAKR